MKLFEKAICEHRIETVKFLLENGMRPDIGDFYLAVREDLVPVASAMVPCIDFNECTTAGRREGTPLHQVRSQEMAEYLVSAGFPADVPDQEGLFPHQTVQDAEITAYLKKLYDELHPPIAQLPAVQKKFTWENRFSTENVSINDLVPVDCDPATGQFKIQFREEQFSPSNRFLTSLARKLKFSSNIFRYFSGEEVFTRIAERCPDIRFKVTVDRQENSMLGVVDEDKKILPPDIACRIFADDKRISTIEYNNGLWEATMMLDETFTVNGDSSYRRALRIHYPVDGVSMPAIYLAVERQICTNGATALVNQFKTEIEINDQSGTHLSRLLRSFSNENGFMALESRIQKAQETKASVNELMTIQALLESQLTETQFLPRLKDHLEAIAGDPCRNYGITSLTNIPHKRRALLPVSCSVNDLLNFCSELSTHHKEILRSTNALDAEIGRMLASEFDLEDMYKNSRTARDFLLNGLELTNERTGLRSRYASRNQVLAHE
ncbi:MAG: hypothetical protein IJS14_00920 [Lentisphaeria bacterium]|nr:hypothetical protein [Lentisphaeria bacterium]